MFADLGTRYYAKINYACHVRITDTIFIFSTETIIICYYFVTSQIKPLDFLFYEDIDDDTNQRSNK